MEVLSRALAARIPHMQLATRVESIDAPRRTVIAIRDGESVAYRYESCLSTIPLPTAIAMCDAAPAALREAAQRLRYNSVLSAMFSIRGPRPKNTGLWRYYPDESLRFTRLVFLHEYDPLLAPTDGWGLLAEVPVPAEAPRERTRDFLAAVRRDVIRAGALPADCEIIAENLVVAETAYVIFDRSAAETAKACRAWLAGHGIASLGRYGRWEYSSMAHALEQGNRWAEVVSSGMLWRDELYA
jgi:protoporphyrinogen oxidase